MSLQTQPPRLGEVQTLAAPAGFRFWDMVEEQFVASGLRVELEPASEPGMRYPATANRSGTYVPWGLTRRFEGPAASPQTPQEQFTLFVQPERREHVPFCIPGLTLQPGQWVALAAPLGGPPRPGMPKDCIPLFPTVLGRRSGWGSIRAELWDDQAQQPAVGALVEVSIPNQRAAWGLTDPQGRVQVWLPWPPVNPPSLSQPTPSAAEWNATIRVYYSAPPRGTPLPDLSASWLHPRAQLVPATPPNLTEITTPLVFGQDLTLRLPTTATSGPSEALHLIPRP